MGILGLINVKIGEVMFGLCWVGVLEGSMMCLVELFNMYFEEVCNVNFD